MPSAQLHQQREQGPQTVTLEVCCFLISLTECEVFLTEFLLQGHFKKKDQVKAAALLGPETTEAAT